MALPTAKLLIAALMIVLCPGALVQAQEQTDSTHHPNEEGAQDHDTSAPDDDHTAEHFHANEVALILAGTYESEASETFFTIGAEYQRFFNSRIGAGVVVEHINDVNAWLLVGNLYYRPVGALKLFTGPGAELKPRRPEVEPHGEAGLSGHSVAASDESSEREETLFLWRFGGGYTFKMGGRYSVTPAITLDLVREQGHWVEALVFGATLGVGF